MKQKSTHADSPKQVLSRKSVETALATMNWAGLRDHLQSVSINPAEVEKLAGWIIRAPNIICKHADRKRQDTRTALLNDLVEFIEKEADKPAASQIESLRDLIVQIERGYASLLADRKAGPLSTLTPTQRVSGVFTLANCAVIEFSQAIGAQIEQQQAVTDSPVVVDATGQSINIDAANTAMVESASMTCLMEAHQNGWFVENGVLVLPDMPILSVDEINICHTGVVSALCWRNWRQAEERRRFLGGKLLEFSTPNLPAWAFKTLLSATEYQIANNEVELIDNIANERLKRGLTQTFFEMIVETNIADQAAGLANKLAIGPGLLVSPEEGHAAVSLSETLSYPIIDDQDEYAGLRLVEWLRGYAVIKQYVQDKFDATDPMSLLPRISRTDLSALLVRLGLTPGKADIFVEQTLFNCGSRDLFDHPLVQLSSGEIALFGPALKSAGLSEVLLSTLGNLKETFERKGKAFEEQTLKFLNNQAGVIAKSTKVKRGGEEFEFDIIAHWDDTVFLFECKTHSLSKSVPQNVHYFRKQAEKDARQTRRLLNALKTYPDILNGLFGEGIAEKAVVSCVLNAFPYSVSGGIDGIAFFDGSALRRFFTNRYLSIKAMHKIGASKLMHRTAVQDFWNSDSPTPGALQSQINNPFQVDLAKGHTEVNDVIFPLNEKHAVAMAQFMENPITQESIAEFYNLDIDSIIKEQKAVEETVARVRNKSSNDTPTK